MEKLKGTLSRTVTSAQLYRIYEILEDEERPYEATIKTVKDKKRLLTIRLRPEDRPYFQNIVDTARNEIKI